MSDAPVSCWHDGLPDMTEASMQYCNGTVDWANRYPCIKSRPTTPRALAALETATCCFAALQGTVWHQRTETFPDTTCAHASYAIPSPSIYPSTSLHFWSFYDSFNLHSSSLLSHPSMRFSCPTIISQSGLEFSTYEEM